MRLGQGGNDSKSDSFTRKDVCCIHLCVLRKRPLIWVMQLRDIFTIHPNTACHTHDLLECPCETGSSGSTQTTNLWGDTDESAFDGDNGDDEKEMGFVSASTMDPARFEKMDQDVSSTLFAFFISSLMMIEFPPVVYQAEEGAARRPRKVEARPLPTAAHRSRTDPGRDPPQARVCAADGC